MAQASQNAQTNTNTNTNANANANANMANISFGRINQTSQALPTQCSRPRAMERAARKDAAASFERIKQPFLCANTLPPLNLDDLDRNRHADPTLSAVPYVR